MGFQLSPGVEIKEFDFTNIIPAVSTSSGAYAGKFVWGPCDEIVTISSENELKSIFGKPTNDNASGWFAAANFLSYGNNLKVVRVINDNGADKAVNAGGGGTLHLPNEKAFEQSNLSFGLVAKYPGVLGNALKIYYYESVTDHTSTTNSFYVDMGVPFSSVFNRAPNDASGLGSDQLTGGSSWAHIRNVYGDEINLVIVDKTGEISGIPNTILETFEGVSRFSAAKNDDGSTNYIRERINSGSNYIWIGNTFAVTASNEFITDGMTVETNVVETHAAGLGSTTLSGGTDGLAPVAGDFYSSDGSKGYGLFLDAEQVDISLILLGAPDGAGAVVVHNTLATSIVQDIAETRKDCIAFVSAPYAGIFDQSTATEKVTDLITWRKTTWNVSSSYAVVDSGWKYQYDPYNDKYRWVPLNGDMAGLCARTDNERDPWYSPAGLNRGQIKRVVKLGLNPNKTQRDELYQVGINPVVAFPGQGTVLFGDKTALAKPSAFDRINVRRLFIVLEKAIATASKFQLFEFNDEFTRASFISLVEPFLRDVQGRRGLHDFKVVCDSSNNTPEVIDGNRFVADIFIKPARSINFMTLNFIATRTGVDFTEVAGGV